MKLNIGVVLLASAIALTLICLSVLRWGRNSSRATPLVMKTNSLNVKAPIKFMVPKTLQEVSDSATSLCEFDDNTAFTKTYLYLVQTESCIVEPLLSPEVLGNTEECNCDVLVVSFKANCNKKFSPHIQHIFAKGSTWTTGRQIQYEHSIESGKKYMYYIFIDDDSSLNVYRGNTTRNGWRTFEKFLYDYRPPVGISDTYSWNYVKRIQKYRKDKGCDKHKDLEISVPGMYWDAMFNSFHHKAAKSVLEPIFPFWAKFDHESWWYSNWYVCVMSDVVYHYNNVYSSEVIAGNAKHRGYPRHSWNKTIVTQIFDDIETLIPTEHKEKALPVLNHWRTCDLDMKRRNEYNYCVDPPTSCIAHYAYA